jgi:predicted nucleic acid-binding protein
MIVDTDVLIWYLKGNEKARAVLLGCRPFSISSITLMELLQGARNKSEQKSIIAQLEAWDTEVIHVSQPESAYAIQLIRDHALSHGITIADALIASTALNRKAELLSANAKHYRFITKLQLQVFRP